jgi:NADH:ubiquinone oxidoreductase subunit 6 (subunit J)
VTALTARALFVAAVTCTLMAAITALGLLAQDDVLAAIAVVAFGVAFFPVWLMSGMLLSTNAEKNGKRRAAWLTVLTALLTAAALLVVTPELAATRDATSENTAGLPGLLTALTFVVTVSVIGLIGYGERGAFERRGRNAS